MKKASFVIASVLVLLVSALAGAFLVVPASANFLPENPPDGIKINSDGSVEGTSLLSQSGNVYTFKGNIYETIVVLRDDVVLDGAGFTLQGNGGSTGVFLQDRTDVVIKNINIKGFRIGIKSTVGYFYWEQNRTFGSNSIIGNIIADNENGIWISAKTSTLVSENHFVNNTVGIRLNSYSVLKNNHFDHNKYALNDIGYGTSKDIDTSNTVNGKPVYYWVNQHDKTVPSDAGFVALLNCSGITVENLHLEGNAQGILLSYTNHSTIKGNIFAQNLEGVTLKESCDNVISGNLIKSNNDYGISLTHSTNNQISKNQIVNNGKDGIYVTYPTSNTIAENHVVENGGNGIFLKEISDSQVIGNNVSFNKGCGIGFGYGPNGVIKENIISKNDVGIWMSNAQDNTITLNSVTDNSGWAVYLEGDQKNNNIYRNNFVNNNITVDGSQVYVKMLWSFPDISEPRASGVTLPPPHLVEGAGNNWDDGNQGNYWSDYQTRYPNASSVDAAIGNTPYFISENNLDYHPLMVPIENLNLDLPSLPSISSVTPTQKTVTTTLESGPNNQPEPFPSALLAAGSGAVVVAVGVAVLIYHKKAKGRLRQ